MTRPSASVSAWPAGRGITRRDCRAVIRRAGSGSELVFSGLVALLAQLLTPLGVGQKLKVR